MWQPWWSEEGQRLSDRIAQLLDRFTRQSFPRSSSLRWRTSPYHTHSHVCGKPDVRITQLLERQWALAFAIRCRCGAGGICGDHVNVRHRNEDGDKCMRSIHLGFPNRKYDAAVSSPEEMTDLWTWPNLYKHPKSLLWNTYFRTPTCGNVGTPTTVAASWRGPDKSNDNFCHDEYSAYLPSRKFLVQLTCYMTL
jgi:hypothetical protein